MSVELGKTRILNALVCDDMRREDNGKEILIGIYSGGVLVHRYPAALTLAIWMQFEAFKTGEIKLAFRLINEKDLEFASATGTLNVSKIENPMSLGIKNMRLQFQADNDFRFQAKEQDSDDWKDVIAFTVRESEISK